MLHRHFWWGLTTGMLVAISVSNYVILIHQNGVKHYNLGYHYYRDIIIGNRDAAKINEHTSQKGMTSLVRKENISDRRFRYGNITVAEELTHKIRVLCWVMTSPENLNVRASVVKKTWGKRCNKLLFFSSVTNTSFPVIGVNVTEGREHLTAKTMEAFQYIYKHHLNDSDWFMKTDDDTYVIMENLRHFLSAKNTSQPVYFGHHFKYSGGKRSYFSGGAAYVISREAMARLGQKGGQAYYCRQDGYVEDLAFANCMRNLGVKLGLSTDSYGRSLFHPFQPGDHLFGRFPEWYYLFNADKVKAGSSSISNYAISFHYIFPKEMKLLEFYLYHLRPYDIHYSRNKQNKELTLSRN